MQMVGRQYREDGGGKYRYGFNGKENDNEIKGDGNQQDYGMGIYDPRVGRFLSVDPITKQYPELTPYQFASNSPIQGIDFDGLELARKEEDPNYIKAFLGVGIATERTTSVAVKQLAEKTLAEAAKNGGQQCLKGY